MHISNLRFLFVIGFLLSFCTGFSRENTNNKEFEDYQNVYDNWLSNFKEVSSARGVVFNGEEYLYGVIDKSGKEIVPCIYDNIRNFEYGLAMVEKGGLFGFINEKGEEIIPCVYTFCSSFKDGLARVCKNEKYGFIDKKGKEIIPTIYDYLSFFKEDLCVFKKDEKYGYINRNGDIIIPASYENALNFMEGLAAVKMNDKWGYIDKTGNFVIPNEYNNVSSFCDGWAVVTRNGRQFYIDKSGNCMLEFNAQYLMPFYNGLAIVFNGDIDNYDLSYGIINKKGEVLIPLEYKEITSMEEYYILKGKNFSKGLVNNKGKIILPCEYDYYQVGDLKDDLFSIEKDGKYGYLSLNGKMQLPFQYISANSFYEDRAGVITTETENNNAPWVFIDKNGKICSERYERVMGFSEGMAGVKDDSLWGYINKSGKTVILPQYDDVSDFQDGLACVKLDGKWGFINKQNNLVIPMKFDYPANFKNGYAIVKKLN